LREAAADGSGHFEEVTCGRGGGWGWISWVGSRFAEWFLRQNLLVLEKLMKGNMYNFNRKEKLKRKGLEQRSPVRSVS
jgi:hypothetical protein